MSTDNAPTDNIEIVRAFFRETRICEPIVCKVLDVSTEPPSLRKYSGKVVDYGDRSFRMSDDRTAKIYRHSYSDVAEIKKDDEIEPSLKEKDFGSPLSLSEISIAAVWRDENGTLRLVCEGNDGNHYRTPEECALADLIHSKKKILIDELHRHSIASSDSRSLNLTDFFEMLGSFEFQEAYRKIYFPLVEDAF